MGIDFSYRPFLTFDKKQLSDLYIVRLAPAEHYVDLEWLGEGSEFTVKIIKDGLECRTVTARKRCARIDGLQTDTEYSVRIESATKQGLTRLFRTGKYFGTVINYLHPMDTQYDYHGRYLAEPAP